jgi:Zn finger protein HypA/HybF involved in hydrogenase expression
MKRTSLVTIDREELQEVVDKSTSYQNVLRLLGYSVCSRNYQALHKAIGDLSINLEKLFLNNAKMRMEKDVVERKTNPKIQRRDLKKILELSGVEEKCNICGLNSWMGNPIVCHIDHRDGDRNNNDLTNLRYLCPNCHSQTATFGGKNLGVKHTCRCCDAVVSGYRTYCNKCVKITRATNQQMKFCPTKDELELKLIEFKYNMSATGRYYGVSDNAVRKRCRKFDLRFKHGVISSNRIRA